jgi:hypothetical protein
MPLRPYRCMTLKIRIQEKRLKWSCFCVTLRVGAVSLDLMGDFGRFPLVLWTLSVSERSRECSVKLR